MGPISANTFFEISLEQQHRDGQRYQQRTDGVIHGCGVRDKPGIREHHAQGQDNQHAGQFATELRRFHPETKCRKTDQDGGQLERLLRCYQAHFSIPSSTSGD